MGGSSSVPEKSIHEFTVKVVLFHFTHTDFTLFLFMDFGFYCVKTAQDSKGKDVDLSIYKGKVLLVVNVASKCGFTNANYPKLTELYKKYKSEGSILGSSIKWNFTKFLVDKEGRVIGRYGTTTSPLSIEGDIKKALAKQ
ncbi:Glutathione peroxidase [Cynara cardunculus var. scolymus]|uniref:Glutathione peroxidase n=1 Tax=Cynara cardunculus var. scolymus TaxID=59895 RepID=A0A124SIF1_CYNCS|nr:Glutathione peroxidase [Cynara cardunculus var. scolymus]